MTQSVHEQWQTVRRVLALRLDNLGDVLLTTPALHAIKESLPDAELTLMASLIGAQAGQTNPDIDDVIVYEAPWMDPWHALRQDSEREQRMIAAVRARRFDGAIIFTSFRESALPGAYLCYLAALSSIDHIVAFDEDTPVELVRAIRPDVFVKGGDYTRDRLPEAAMVEALGGTVEILPYLDDHSTTGMIERIQAAYRMPQLGAERLQERALGAN